MDVGTVAPSVLPLPRGMPPSLEPTKDVAAYRLLLSASSDRIFLGLVQRHGIDRIVRSRSAACMARHDARCFDLVSVA